MFPFIKNLFSSAPQPPWQELVEKGAVIIDVRSKAEYQQGHIKGSINIPLQSLQGSLDKIKKDKPVITCCASGMRSESAKNVLAANGFTEVYNGGGWQSLNNQLK